MPNYIVGQDIITDGMASGTPYWVLAVVRFKQVATFSRDTMSSATIDGSEVAAEAGPPLIITDDCLSVSTRASKDSHVKNLVATLLPGNYNYLSTIFPNDWVMCWMLQSETDGLALVQRIKDGKPCNGFKSGLKFVGRVQSIRKSLSVSPAGNKHAEYQLQGIGFGEFDSTIFWDPYLAVAQPFINTWIGALGIKISEFLKADGIDVNGAIPELLEILFGRGISQKTANPAEQPTTQAVTGSTAGNEDDDAPFAYVVPSSVGTILGRKTRSKKSGVLAYADLLEPLFGVQQYQFASSTAQPSDFTPTHLKPLEGRFLPVMPNLNMVPMWSVLSQYLNPACNEMYVCLRAHSSGDIFPTLVVRQLPFSSALSNTGLEVTKFLELPRWEIPPEILFHVDIGRSDALRFNFVHVLAEAQSQALANSNTKQLVAGAPPVRDDQDIRRAGLRADMGVVCCGPDGQQLGVPEWVKLRSDILMGGHLALTGTVSCLGIQEPICEGDNLELDGVVFHIEQVAHTAAIKPNGQRSFMTTLQLTHGMRANPDESKKDIGLYAATLQQDNTKMDPGLTNDTTSNNGPEGTILGDFFSGGGNAA